jgi:hypothetical protein
MGTANASHLVARLSDMVLHLFENDLARALFFENSDSCTVTHFGEKKP